LPLASPAMHLVDYDSPAGSGPTTAIAPVAGPVRAVARALPVFEATAAEPGLGVGESSSVSTRATAPVADGEAQAQLVGEKSVAFARADGLSENTTRTPPRPVPVVAGGSSTGASGVGVLDHGAASNPTPPSAPLHASAAPSRVPAAALPPADAAALCLGDPSQPLGNAASALGPSTVNAAGSKRPSASGLQPAALGRACDLGAARPHLEGHLRRQAEPKVAATAAPQTAGGRAGSPAPRDAAEAVNSEHRARPLQVQPESRAGCSMLLQAASAVSESSALGVLVPSGNGLSCSLIRVEER
jgi:hypothetical protein